MKLHLPKVLLSAVLTACCAFSAQAVELPDTYTQITIADSNQLSDYTTNTETDSYAFLLGQDIVVSSDITMDGGNLLFTSSDGLPSVSLEFTGGDAPALSNQSSLVFDTLSGLSFTNYKDSAIYTSGNLVIQNVNDGVEDSENPDVLFTGNTATATTTSSYYYSYSYGGAIYADSVSITGNGDVTFTGNTATASSSYAYSYAYSYGGAIYARSGDVSITGNGDVSFLENSASTTSSNDADHSYGGAIYAGGGVSITGNGDVSFSGNSASSSSLSSGIFSFGGAIYASSVNITGNRDVSFLGNSVSSCGSRGGAIYAFSGVCITGNGDVTFSENSVSSFYFDSVGGAIYAAGGDVSITGNGDVLFTGNSASSSASSSNAYSYGGAICSEIGNVSISGNETVCFEKNYESENSTYRLRSIHVGGENVHGEYVEGDLNLSAKTGGHITIYDSVYGGTTSLNADYTDADGNTQQAKGNIIFSGQYTKTHLDAILEANHEGRVATDAEILNSRTSTLGDTTLYGGTLQVLDGAILDTASLSVEAGSRARVLLRDAELKGSAGITFDAGTTLQVQGDSLITGDVLLLAGSSLDIDGAITINGGLTLGQGLTLSGDILVNIQNLEIGQSLTLVSGLESLAVQTQELVRSVEYTTVLSGQELSAADYFS
ncbi:MAG: hypothetical protein IIV41_02180, partial [Akkermansia sp.]|nr:hypothetical protein [Akkermansia sp.]